MKKHFVPTVLFLLVAVSVFVVSPTTSDAQRAHRSVATGGDDGRLIIWRIATLGNDLVVGVSIDGRHVADLTYGKHFDAPISPGRHTVTILAYPRIISASGDSAVINVRPGELYNFTAKGSVTQLVLKRS
jgi:hypothetical protein